MRFPGNALLNFLKRAFRLFTGNKAGISSNACAIFCAFGLAGLLTGCAQNEPRADIVILNGAEPESLDPAIITGQPDGRVVMALFEGLMRLDPVTATPIPGLAEKWDISADGKVYTFHLRTNAVWSTGEPITAEDVVYSWRRVADPATASDYAGQLFFVKNAEEINTGKIKDITQLGVQALNPYTLRVELVSPTPFFLELCAFRTLYVVPRHWIAKHGDRWLMEKPLPTSGQYTLEDWRINNKIRVRKNPRHWDAVNIKNELVDFLPIESGAAALNLYEMGQADIIWDKGLVPAELMDVLKNRPDCHKFDYLGTYFVRFNTTREPFKDPRVRKALNMAIDKKRIVERITKAGERIATTLTPPGIADYQAPPGVEYNPEAARKLLAEAGYPGGQGFPTFRYHFNTSKQHEYIAVELQQMWKQELGINMELKQTEWKVYLAAQSALDFDTMRSSWIGDYNDPNTFLDMFMSNNGNNRTGWKNERYDELLRKGNATLDKKERARLLAEAEAILIQEGLPIAPLYYYVGINFYDPKKLTGIYPNILDEHPIQSIQRLDKVKQEAKNR